MMQLDLHFMFASGLDRMFQVNLMPVDFVTDLVLQARHNVVGGDGAKGLAGFAGLELKRQAQLINSPGKLFRFVQLTRLAFRAFFLQITQLTQSSRSHLVGFAPGQEMITRITATDLDHVRLGTQTRDILC